MRWRRSREGDAEIENTFVNKRKIGLIMIVLGVSVWVIYAALKLADVSVNVGVALAIHLAFVIPGALLAPGENLYGKFIQLFRRDKSEDAK